MTESERPAPANVIADAAARAGAAVLRNRRLVRAPIKLYRAGFGFLFGSRLLMLEHTGRKSGLSRYVVLEVIGHPAPGTYIVVSGFGPKAQWFQNVRADPRVRVTLAWRRAAPATARVLARADAERALTEYATHHPRAWKTLKPIIESALGRPITEFECDLPLVSLDLDG